MSEQRRFSRVPFEAESTLSVHRESFPAVLIDISLKGALVELPGAPAPALGTPVMLEVRLPGGDVTIRMRAEVAHHEETRAGLRCVSIDLDSISHLRRLLELNSGDPSLIERELSALI